MLPFDVREFEIEDLVQDIYVLLQPSREVVRFVFPDLAKCHALYLRDGVRTLLRSGWM